MTPLTGTNRPGFILALEYDLSLTTGYSINERESAVALLDAFPDQVRVVCPAPAFPEDFSDPRITYVRDHRRHDPVRYPLFVTALMRRLLRMARERPPAAVIFRPGPLPIVPLWATRQGWPVILKKLSGYSLFGREGRGWKRRALATLATPLYRDLTRRCLAADVESNAYAEWLPSRFPIDSSRIKVIPNGANARVFHPHDRLEARRRFGWDRFEHIVGYTGALDELRCIDTAVEAAIRLKDVPGLGVVLVGDGPLLPSLKERVRSLGLADRILFPGFLPYRDIPAVVSAFDLALDLSRVPLSVEGRLVFGSFSQKVAQYLACGVPVISWTTADTTFLDEAEVGRTVPMGDIAALVGTIEAMLRPGNGSSSLEGRARAFACENLSAPSIARARVEWWEGLVARVGSDIGAGASRSPGRAGTA
jgi:glycosyltransferase involved in cell wall biosynthesis